MHPREGAYLTRPIHALLAPPGAGDMNEVNPTLPLAELALAELALVPACDVPAESLMDPRGDSAS